MQMTSLRVRTLAALAATGLLAGALVPAQASATTAPMVYVAMGDSFAAGSLVLPAKEPLTCARSAVNYASLIAAELKPAKFRDVTCGGATTAHFANPQSGIILGQAPPQYDALSADTTVVSVGIGGNDIGLVGLAFSCVNLLPPGVGTSCKAANTSGGVDKLAQKIDAFAATYGTVIEQIRQRAPHAKILMVGYPTGIRKGGCWPVVPVWPTDADYLQAALTRLNLRMAQQASEHGATYVDLATPSVGHDMCKPAGTRWIEGLIPSVTTNGLVPLHPNAAGLRNAVPTVLAAMAGSGGWKD